MLLPRLDLRYKSSGRLRVIDAICRKYNNYLVEDVSWLLPLLPELPLIENVETKNPELIPRGDRRVLVTERPLHPDDRAVRVIDRRNIRECNVIRDTLLQGELRGRHIRPAGK